MRILAVTALALVFIGVPNSTYRVGIAAATNPRAVVAVYVQSPDFTVRELKYRVFYNKAEVKHIPLTDYDFKAAFTDELLNALSADTRLAWRKQSDGEQIDIPAIMDKKAAPPNVEADHLLLVNVQEYGAFLASLAADKFYMMARFKLVERTSGRKIWEKKLFERVDLNGKVDQLSADNQKGLKLGINKVLEKLCSKLGTEIRGAKI